jgi:hypothetical protein
MALNSAICQCLAMAKASTGRQLALSFRGSPLRKRDVARIRQLVREHPHWSRAEISRQTCRLFGWRRSNGELAVDACRGLLARLHDAGEICLPPSRRKQGQAKPSAGGGLSPRPDFLVGPPQAWEVDVDWEASLVVRPIVGEERLGWRTFMQRLHYLGDPHLVGESLRYVAALDSTVVALLAWSTATLHNGPRDHYINWDELTKRRNLHLVANNSRFLMLHRRRNLASRILGANLRRLSSDWQARYGHPIWLAETFVDTRRYRGTCYRASNWQHVGETRGWSKHGAQYQFHGQTKAVFVYSLRRDSVRKLSASQEQPMSYGEQTRESIQIDVEGLQIEGEEGLLDVLDTVLDWRKARGKRHPMRYVLAVACCATLAGAKTFAGIADWAKDQSHATLMRLGAKYGRPPSKRTVQRVLAKVDVKELDEKTGCWVAKHTRLKPGDALAVDGKTLRGSGDGDGRAVHLLSAVVHREGTTVAQTPVPGKTNEITCVEPLLKNVDIQGAVITADALLTQKKIANYIVDERKADFVFTAKDNQPTLKEDIQYFFENQHREAERIHEARGLPSEKAAFPPRARNS